MIIGKVPGIKHSKIWSTIALILLIPIIMTACSQKSIFRGHQYGDSIDEVTASEKETYEKEYSELEERTYIRYDKIKISEYSGYLSYIFYEDELEQIFYYITSYKETISLEDAYDKIIKEYSPYGEIIEEEIIDEKIHKALIKQSESGIVLVIEQGNYCAVFHRDYNKCKLFYDTLSFSVLVQDDSDTA